MSQEPAPPPDTLQIRCARLGHQIHFSYCRTENFGLPCPRIIHCWHPWFAVEAYLRGILTEDQWRETFAKPVQPKVLTLVELIEQAQKNSAKSVK
jgi:hypothetical protein